MQKVRRPQAEPENPADALEDAGIREVDAAIEERMAQFTNSDLRFFFSCASSGNRAQQSSAKKPKDKNNVPVNRVDHSKKQKQRKGKKKLTAREKNAAETAKMQVEGFVTFWHDGKWHRVAE